MLLNEETGTFLLGPYGNVQAFGFKGDKDFVRRSYNLCYNYGITNKRLHKLSEGLYYVVTNEKNILEGLKNHFVNEIKYTKEISLLKDEYDENNEVEPYLIQYDEEKIDKLATDRAAEFFAKKIILSNFMPEFSINNNKDCYLEPHSVNIVTKHGKRPLMADFE